jgi:GH15 family glucan-1,4-alpha-glucosidase
MKSAIAVLALVFAGLAFAADVTGKWNATTQSPDGQQMQLVFNFKQDGEKLSGTVTGPPGDLPISEGKVSGDSISFNVQINDMTIVHKGTVSGDEMKLKVEIGDQTMDLTAKRAK